MTEGGAGQGSDPGTEERIINQTHGHQTHQTRYKVYYKEHLKHLI